MACFLIKVYAFSCYASAVFTVLLFSVGKLIVILILKENDKGKPSKLNYIFYYFHSETDISNFLDLRMYCVCTDVENVI